MRPTVGRTGHRRGAIHRRSDVVKNLTPNLNASITVNTDFAETEADIRQVNLTRFPLSFLKNAHSSWKAQACSMSRDWLAAPTSSRFSRVALHYGNEDIGGGEVPIDVGAKLVGRQSDYNVGVLDVEMRALPAASLDRQNMFAARVSRNLFEQSWVGAIVTNGIPMERAPTICWVPTRDSPRRSSAVTRTFRWTCSSSASSDQRLGQDYAGGFGLWTGTIAGTWF